MGRPDKIGEHHRYLTAFIGFLNGCGAGGPEVGDRLQNAPTRSQRDAHFPQVRIGQQRDIGETGFQALWKVNSFASSVGKLTQLCSKAPSECSHQLTKNQFGVQLGHSVDAYTMTDRAIKYGFLFICLTFIVFAL